MRKIWIPSKLKVPRYIPRCHATIQNSHATISVSRPAGLARPKKSHATIQTVPRYNFRLPVGTQKSQKSTKLYTKITFFKTSENGWQKKNIINLRTFLSPQNGAGAFIKHRFVHVDPAPKWHRNDIRNFAFCYLWNQTSLKMPKKNISEKKLLPHG